MSDFPKLRLVENSQVLQDFPLSKPEIMIGREAGNDLVITQPSISRRHARLLNRSGSWTLESLSEANPVILNDQSLAGAGPRLLQNGDRFVLGSLMVYFVGAPGQARPPAPPAGSQPLSPKPALSSTEQAQQFQLIQPPPATLPPSIPPPTPQAPPVSSPPSIPPPSASLPTPYQPYAQSQPMSASPAPIPAPPQPGLPPSAQAQLLPAAPPMPPQSALPSFATARPQPPAPQPGPGQVGPVQFPASYSQPPGLEAQSPNAVPPPRPTTKAQAPIVPPRSTMVLDENDLAAGIPGGGQFIPQEGFILRVVYGSTSLDYPLTEPQMTIGRASDASIPIPISTVSRLHAILTRTPGGYTITDQGSSNGLLYRGEKVRQAVLQDGDVVRIGDDLGNCATLTYDDLSHPNPQPVQVLQLEPQVKQVRIGRNPDNNLVLSYPAVSTYHALIVRGPSGDMLHDLGSTNGTFVHNQRVRPNSPVRIAPGDLIKIASYTLVYQYDVIAQPNTDKVRIDAIGVGKAVNNNKLVLLNDISVSIQPKEFVAIVGGSGTGKSTLLDALNGFRPAPLGQVFMNGEDYYQNFGAYRSSLGYVPQDDIIHRDLTVGQALYYVARLRLPKDTSRKEIEARIVEVLEDVEMTKRRDVLVSRLSGGQRKRVSIAVELISKPTLFFLDEPTSGLDPGLDKRMMYLLRRLADQGRTIILITHATNNITACDKVVFLAPGGRLCFFGPPQEALGFFEVGEFADIYTKLEQNGEEWEGRFRQSPFYHKYITVRLAELPATAQIGPAYAPAMAQSYNAAANTVQAAAGTMPGPASQQLRAPKTSGWRQFLILTRRYAALVRRDRVNVLVLLLQAPIIGLILALVAGEKIFADNKSPANAQQVLFIMSIAAVWLGTSNAARELTKETPIYLRERLVNLRVLPYVLSKVAVLTVLCLLQSVMLAGVVMLRSGVPPTGAILPPALELIVAVWLTTMGGLGMGLLVSALASNVDKAGSIVPIILVPQIILAGVIFDLSGPSQALSYVTVSKWSIDTLGTSADTNRLFYQLVKQDVKTGNGGTYDPHNYDNNPTARKYVIDGRPTTVAASEIKTDRALHLLSRWLILVGMFVLFIALTCYFQKRKDKIWEHR